MSTMQFVRVYFQLSYQEVTKVGVMQGLITPISAQVYIVIGQSTDEQS